MRERGALRDARGAARVLQERRVLQRHRHGLEAPARAGVERLGEPDVSGQRVRRHQLLDPPHREIDDRALREAEHLAERGDHDVLHGGPRDHLLQRAAKFSRITIASAPESLQLVLELARRVQRIDVDDDVARAQHARKRDRVLHDVRHHDRDARALGEALRLQPRAERGRVPVDLAEGEVPVHVRVGVALGVLAQAVLDAARPATNTA